MSQRLLEILAQPFARRGRLGPVILEREILDEHAQRISDGMYFALAENELIARVERRIAALLRWPVENGEFRAAPRDRTPVGVEADGGIDGGG